MRWIAVIACGALAAAAVGAGYARAHAQSAAAQASTTSQSATGTQNQAGSEIQANAQNVSAAEAGKPPEAPLTAGPPPRQIAAESADLLKMATALKSEVDKTTKDQLSVTVVRKASEIEQLAHKARLGGPKS